MNRKRAVLITLADKSHVEQAKQLFAGAHFKGGWTGDYLLLANNIPERELEAFRKRGIKVMKCKPIFKTKSRHPDVVTAKLSIFKSYFKRWGNVLFLDADILIKASIQDLADSKGIQAVSTYREPLLGKHKLLGVEKDASQELNKMYKEIKENYNLEKKGINSGVIAFNTNIITESTFNEICTLCKKYQKVLRTDEAVLGLYFNKMLTFLPLVYNISMKSMLLDHNIPAEKARGIILHFVGKQKPWNKKNPYYAEWISMHNKFNELNMQKKVEPDKWGVLKICLYCWYLAYKKHLYDLQRKLVSLDFMHWYVDHKIGVLGERIHEKIPMTYSILKRLNPIPKYTHKGRW
ncbi:hypothetical protein HYZ97_00175 [Candidatus Pacearchaeota archaeon]|nr:hypothetical protein [Candidatus Pacearchaeota archaeon]